MTQEERERHMNYLWAILKILREDGSFTLRHEASSDSWRLEEILKLLKNTEEENNRFSLKEQDTKLQREYVRAKIKGDAGIYQVWVIDWLNRRVLVSRNCGDEWVDMKKIILTIAT